MKYSLTHQQEQPDGEYNHIHKGTFTQVQLIKYIRALGNDMAYQYYVTEWDTNNSPNENDWLIGEQINADEWLEEYDR